MEYKDARDSMLTNEINTLWILLNHTTNAISRQREAELSEYGISIEKHAILHALIIKDGQNIRDIAAVRLRRHHSIFTLIIRMEKQGLITKIKSSRSKEYKIYITEKGKELYFKIPSNSLESIFPALTRDDQQKLSQYLKLLMVRSLTMQGFDYKLPFLL
jgi:DNA-binding MarR family transcriptional regulator